MLIADSGSTKCDWALIKKGQQRINFQTAGFNPFFHQQDFIVRELKKNKGLMACSGETERIFFYGAGCSSKDRNRIIKESLKRVFRNAAIVVEHDLAAAAYAVYEGKPCIAAIAGTGSNSCFFDGKKIREEVPALGYVLGDEGSGSYFGKILLKKFLYHQLPPAISEILQRKYKLSKESIFENVYSKKGANVYLASFFRVIAEFKDEPFIREMIALGMWDFLQNHVCCFKEYKKVKTHFVGSVGFIFDDIIRETAQTMGISIGKIIKQPIDGLVDYHLGTVTK